MAEVADARRHLREHLEEAGLRTSPAPSASLLQDTVDQFEKVIDLERNLLCKSIMKLEHDLDETGTEVSMKEEELMVWEERLQQIQQDNEKKLRLAKVRAESTRWRQKSESRRAGANRRSSPLGFIAEGNEDSSADEQVDEDEETAVGSTLARSDACSSLPRPASLATVEAINTLAGSVANELALLQSQWQQLVAATEAASAVGQPQVDSVEQWFRIEEPQGTSSAPGIVGRAGVPPASSPSAAAGAPAAAHAAARPALQLTFHAVRGGGAAAPRGAPPQGAGLQCGAQSPGNSLPQQPAVQQPGTPQASTHQPSMQPGAMPLAGLPHGAVAKPPPQHLGQLPGARAPPPAWHAPRPGMAGPKVGGNPGTLAWAQLQRMPARA